MVETQQQNGLNNMEIFNIMKNLVELSKKEMKNTNGGSIIGAFIGVVEVILEYTANHEAKIHLPGGQAMKQ